MSSEKTYDLPEQPGATCPIVDAGEKALRQMAHNQPRDSAIRHADEDELRDMLEDLCGDIDYYTSDVEEALESCRQQAVDIRAWGQAWKDLAKGWADEIDTVQTPWDGVMLWWRQVGEDRWRKTWLYRIAVLPRVRAGHGPNPVII